MMSHSTHVYRPEGLGVQHPGPNQLIKQSPTNPFAPSVPLSYPIETDGLPLVESRSGEYQIRFARNRQDLDKVLKLRFEVYNLELGEGLETSYFTERDIDKYDHQCHHLMVIHTRTDAMVGTYRMQTYGMAESHFGFYTASEFALEDLPDTLKRDAVEVGRACIDRAHRNGRVLQLLWKGLAHYLNLNRKRYLFGCCSLASQNPIEGQALLEQLRIGGHCHPEYWAAPRPEMALDAIEINDPMPIVEVPRLLQGYLNLGGVVCGNPAIDREFKTIDYLVLVDVEAMPRGLFQRFLRD